jgi:hypothetical protein
MVYDKKTDTTAIILIGSVLCFTLGYVLIRTLIGSKDKYYFLVFPKTLEMYQVLLYLQAKSLFKGSSIVDCIVIKEDCGTLVYLKTVSFLNIFYWFDPLREWVYLTEESALSKLATFVSDDTMMLIMQEKEDPNKVVISSMPLRVKLVQHFLSLINSCLKFNQSLSDTR